MTVPLNEDTDALRWADEFRAVLARDPTLLSADRDWLIGWFANAIMCGHDHALRQEGKPIPLRLVCETCGKLHIDEGEFAAKVHHTHTCQFCGLTWRPAIVATVGVQFLPGFKNP